MRRVMIALALFLCGVQAPAFADAYPNRPIILIVPFAAGSGTDSVARVIARRLSEVLKADIVIDTRAGANGAIGAAAAARAAPDGYTLFSGGTSTQYDPANDFAPIAQLGTFPYFLFVYPGTPAKDVRELVALAKAKPGSVSFAYGNALGRLAGEMLKKRTGADLLAVPYKSSPQGITDLITGRVTIMFCDMPPAVAQLKDGRLRALATTTADRSALFPEYPSMKEAGVDLFDLTAWTGLFAPRGTAPEIIAKLSAAARDVLGDADTRERLANVGFEAKWYAPEEFAKRASDDLELWATLTREAGIERQ